MTDAHPIMSQTTEKKIGHFHIQRNELHVTCKLMCVLNHSPDGPIPFARQLFEWTGRLGFGPLPTKLLSSLHRIVKSRDRLSITIFGSHTCEPKIYEFALKLSILITGSGNLKLWPSSLSTLVSCRVDGQAT